MELRVNEVAIPERIDFNYEELKAELTSKVSFYETLVYTDDQIKDAKADRVKLRKLKDALNSERIRREREYMQPFNEFKAQINEIIGIIDKPIAVIDEQVKAFDEKRKAEKQKAIEELFADMGFQNFVTLEKIQDPKWLNASVSMKSIEDQMRSKMYEIGNGVLTLSQLPEFGFEATEVFKETLDINKAISEAKRMSEIAKAKAEAETRRKAEEERKAQERVTEEQRAAMAQVMTPPEPVQSADSAQERMVVRFATLDMRTSSICRSLDKGYPEGIPCNKQTAEAWGISEGDLFKCNPYLQIRCVDGSHSMWVPSINDCLAEDWVIIE